MRTSDWSSDVCSSDLADPDAALTVRQFDRVFDNHVMTPVQEVVADALRGPENHLEIVVDKAKAALEAVYGWLDEQLAEGGWATPHGFTLADCAAAPSLFYADWVHRIAPRYANLRSEEHTSELQSLMRISYA